MQHRRLAIPLLVLSTLTVAACGSDHDSHSSGSSAADTSASGSTGGSTTDIDAAEADVFFAQGMIPHHEQAIEMADIALDPTVGAGTAVVDLAERIKGAQDPEIELMRGWLQAWGEPSMEDLPGHDMSSMEGMMSAEDMDRLGTLKGSEFDTAWLEMMIAHHEGAVTMAEDVRQDGSDPEVLSLADRIIAAQQAEITEMKALLAG